MHKAALPLFSLPSSHNCIVLQWQSVNDQCAESDAEPMAPVGVKEVEEEEGLGGRHVYDIAESMEIDRNSHTVMVCQEQQLVMSPLCWKLSNRLGLCIL